MEKMMAKRMLRKARRDADRRIKAIDPDYKGYGADKKKKKKKAKPKPQFNPVLTKGESAISAEPAGRPTHKIKHAKWGHLEVKLVSGHNLLAKDSNGLSDPYVKIGFESKDGFWIKGFHITSPVVKKSLNPVWDCTLKVPVYHHDIMGEYDDKLTFDVWDKDLMSKDDHMGQGSIPGWDAREHKMAKLGEFTVKLQQATEDGEGLIDAGELKVVLELQPTKTT